MKNKKYWYLKLESDFFNRHDIRYLLSSNIGIKAVLVYQALMLESISHEGYLRFNKGKPYTVEILHNIFFSTFNNLEETKECFKELETMDLIKWEKDKTLYIKGVAERVGSTTDQANYMMGYRERKKEETLQESLQCKPNVRQESLQSEKSVITNVSLDIEKDIEREKDIDIEEKNIKKENDNIYSLKKFLEVLEEYFGGIIPPKYCDIATKLYEEFGYDDSMREIAIQNEMGFKAIETAYNSLKRNDGSSWLKQIKREL